MQGQLRASRYSLGAKAALGEQQLVRGGVEARGRGLSPCAAAPEAASDAVMNVKLLVEL